MSALVIHPDGDIIYLTLNPGRSHLNCAAVDAVSLTSVLDMWFDPDGPGRQPFNRVATILAGTYGRIWPYFGPVLICGGTPEGASADLDRGQVLALLTRLEDVASHL